MFVITFSVCIALPIGGFCYNNIPDLYFEVRS
jgi:hypothetical protein